MSIRKKLLRFFFPGQKSGMFKASFIDIKGNEMNLMFQELQQNFLNKRIEVSLHGWINPLHNYSGSIRPRSLSGCLVEANEDFLVMETVYSSHHIIPLSQVVSIWEWEDKPFFPSIKDFFSKMSNKFNTLGKSNQETNQSS